MPRAMLRPVKSAESLATASNVQRSQSERRTSKTEANESEAENDPSSSNELLDKSLLESSDDLCPLEAVSKAVASSNVMKDRYVTLLVQNFDTRWRLPKNQLMLHFFQPQ